MGMPARARGEAADRQLLKVQATGRALRTAAGHGQTSGQMKNPLVFIQEVRQEVSKVTWPTWKEVWITTVMVLIMVALTSIFFMVADQIIASVVKYILGAGQPLPG
jgi:preprotein translocase subunit SecE